LQGGLVLAVNRDILGELPLPIGGLMVNKSIEDIANTVWKLGKASRAQMGGKMEDPFSCLQFQGHQMIPALKLSDRGLMDTKGKSW
jgi:adenine deaminase